MTLYGTCRDTLQVQHYQNIGCKFNKGCIIFLICKNNRLKVQYPCICRYQSYHRSQYVGECQVLLSSHEWVTTEVKECVSEGILSTWDDHVIAINKVTKTHVLTQRNTFQHLLLCQCKLEIIYCCWKSCRVNLWDLLCQFKLLIENQKAISAWSYFKLTYMLLCSSLCYVLKWSNRFFWNWLHFSGSPTSLKQTCT